MKANLFCSILLMSIVALWGRPASADVKVYHPEREGWTSYSTLHVDDAIDDFNADGVEGKVLKFSNGTYPFSHQITPRAGSKVTAEDGVTLVGASGTGTTGLDDKDLIKVLGDGVGINHIQLCRETQTRANVTGAGINANGHYNVVIKDVTIEMQNIGITSSDTSGLLPVSCLIIDRVEMRYINSKGIYVKGYAVEVKNTEVKHVMGNGIELVVCKNVNYAAQSRFQITNSWVRFCNGNGISLSGVGGYPLEGTYTDISHNWIEQVSGNGIVLLATDGVDIADNMIRGCGTGVAAPASGVFYVPGTVGWTTSWLSGGGYAIQVGNESVQTTIANNILRSNGSGGVFLGSGMNSDLSRVGIMNNYIDGGVYGICIDTGLGSAEMVRILGNQISNVSTGVYQPTGMLYVVVICNNILPTDTSFSFNGIDLYVLDHNQDF